MPAASFGPDARPTREVLALRSFEDEICQSCSSVRYALKVQRAVDGLKKRSRKLFVTTKTELKAIAAPAIIGFRKPSAATGMASTL